MQYVASTNTYGNAVPDRSRSVKDASLLSNFAQIRDTSELAISVSAPRIFTRSSTLRTLVPMTYAPVRSDHHQPPRTASRAHQMFPRKDNVPEPTCRAVTTWTEGIVDLAIIPPGERRNNGDVESFHRCRLNGLLRISTFPNLIPGRVELADLHHEHNSICRHSNFGYQLVDDRSKAPVARRSLFIRH